MSDLADLEQLWKQPFTDNQLGALQQWQELYSDDSGEFPRMCLYHKTGAGKTRTSLSMMFLAHEKRVLVVAPPITQPQWRAQAAVLDIEVTCISHAKFRQSSYKLQRECPIIVDEFHLLGGHTGVGWKKLDRNVRGLKAPLIICSATPNYNDAERCYCVQHVLDPRSAGNYLDFLYANCTLKMNPFAKTPEVVGWQHGIKDSEEFLSKLPHVHYVEDDVIKQLDIDDVMVQVDIDINKDVFELGLDYRRERIIASQMERTHALKRYRILNDSGYPRQRVIDALLKILHDATTPVMIFSESRTIALAIYDMLEMNHMDSLIVSGDITQKQKESAAHDFITGTFDVLVGTATLATGLDGVDKMCDTLIIVDDTDDPSLRRQLIGRILPRGIDTDVSNKRVYRLVYV